MLLIVPVCLKAHSHQNYGCMLIVALFFLLLYVVFSFPKFDFHFKPTWLSQLQPFSVFCLIKCLVFRKSRNILAINFLNKEFLKTILFQNNAIPVSWFAWLCDILSRTKYNRCQFQIPLWRKAPGHSCTVL